MHQNLVWQEKNAPELHSAGLAEHLVDEAVKVITRLGETYHELVLKSSAAGVASEAIISVICLWMFSPMSLAGRSEPLVSLGRSKSNQV